MYNVFVVVCVSVGKNMYIGYNSKQLPKK